MATVSDFLPYPTPFNQATNQSIISFAWDQSDDFELRFVIYNSIGTIIFDQTLASGSFPVASLDYKIIFLKWTWSAGLYIARIYEGGSTQRATVNFTVV